MSTRITPREYLTNTDRAILAQCYRCSCEPCTRKRGIIEKMLRIIDGKHVGETATQDRQKDDDSLKV